MYQPHPRFAASVAYIQEWLNGRFYREWIELLERTFWGMSKFVLACITVTVTKPMLLTFGFSGGGDEWHLWFVHVLQVVTVRLE